MHAQAVQPGRSRRRRGVVLVLILAMLSIMALLGVTFATLSRQSQVGAFYYAQAAQATPDVRTMFDFGLEQLINDSNNPKSALRGHGLLRDMYGQDARTNGYLPRLPDPLGMPLMVINAQNNNGIYTIQTNIPTPFSNLIALVPQLYGVNFVGWTLRLQQWYLDGNGVPVRQAVPPIGQTFVVTGDDFTGSTHVLQLSPADTSTPGLVQPDSGPVGNIPAGFTAANLFELDSRYRNAFNGGGQNPSVPGAVAIPGEFPNFLYNNVSIGGGYTDPNNFSAPALDEDYDAPDTENWFMAMKSADGQVVIPSFFRPWTIAYDPQGATPVNDWLNTTAAGRAKFLRPRKVDHPASGDAFPDLVPDTSGSPNPADVTYNPNWGKITYDVDNDGDGVTDSVWIDLGYPVQRDAGGKLYKPLFAIMCLPLNGRLPLNTAGNIQGRKLDGTRSFDHAAGRGYSPNEVDPRYALNRNLNPPSPVPGSAFNTLTAPAIYPATGSVLPVPLPTPEPPWPAPYGLRSGQSSLQALLAGNPGTQTPGRYGELEALRASPIQFPGPGRSYLAGAPNSPWFDANFNSTDFYPLDLVDPTTKFPFVEAENLYDAAGRHMLPSERLRRMVTPLDLTGNGRLVRFDELPKAPDLNAQPIPDPFGTPFGSGFDNFGRVGFYLHYRPPGVVREALPPANNGQVNVTRSTLNRYHGYESYRNPVGTNTNVMGRASWNIAGTNNDTTYPELNVNTPNPRLVGAVQTINPSVGTDSPNPPILSSVVTASLGMNEAAQLDLYRAQPYDEPFQNSDQEWLLRKDDVDGSSLFSRLDTLLPAGNGQSAFFDNPLNRQLFSVESWEPNTYAWSLQPTGATLPTGAHVAHRNRKVNLNFPLPPVSGPTPWDEPVRRKWITEVYGLLRGLLYPTGTTPTAEQLHELGQYVVNIVDFRDPDGVMTRWVHPELELKPAGTDANGNKVPAGVKRVAAGSPGTLEIWGMEYQPVAINEVLAFQYLRKTGATTKTPTPRLFIELANLLTEDGNGTQGSGGTASNLSLNGWGLVITPDNPAAPAAAGTQPGWELPNTATGQLDAATIKDYFVPLGGTGVGTTATPGPLNPVTKALTAQGLPDYNARHTTSSGTDRNNYYVLSNTAPASANGYNEVGRPEQEPTATTQLDTLTKQLPALPAASGQRDYFWLHLLRPVDPSNPTSPKVVVDSIRFPYYEAGYDIITDTTTGQDIPDQKVKVDIASVGRLQPLRGAQLVPNVHKFSPPFSYGYTDQVWPDNGADTQNSRRYRPQLNTKDLTGYTATAGGIYESIGANNNPDEQANSGVGWCYLPFHDRDFTSVAELLLVPNVPPGLFTKFFVERATTDPANPQAPQTAPLTAYTQPPLQRTVLSNADLGVLRLQKAPVYPYLPDGFFYQSRPAEPNPILPTGATESWFKHKAVGWHRMLEFFEVPSPVQGAIGPVAEGDNGDWLRKDLRPGAINLNAIYDEEVFFGLLGDGRLNSQPAFPDPPQPGQSLAATPGTGIPRMITALNAAGLPATSVPVSDLTPGTGYPQGRGYLIFNPLTLQPMTYMKAAFADFLKLRHGGSGYIGVFRSPNLPNTAFGNTLVDRPFRGLAYPDLHDTLLRPARLPFYQRQVASYADQTERPLKLVNPPRLLFQVPDGYDQSAATNADPSTELGSPSGTPLPTTTVPPTDIRDGDHVNLSFKRAGLVNPQLDPFTNPLNPAQQQQAYFLGSRSNDRREHPAFRYEWLEKVLNLGTVRSHQYAVWVTVGLFEVVREGNPQLAGINPAGVPDQLGPELGTSTGRVTRYRMFALIDRSRATGFDPANPPEFRQFVVHSRRIE